MIGYLAYSLAGHDKGEVYLIVQEDADYVWLADGDIRTLDNPKKKNKKHMQVIKKAAYQELLTKESVTNEEVKRFIKLYCKDMQEVK